MSKISGKELAEQLGDFVNNYNHDAEAFIDGFCRQHRTLQQSSFRLILQLIEKVASDDYATDGRNEGSKKVAKQLLNGFKLELIKGEMERGMSREDSEKYANNEHCKPKNFLGHI
jgi:hypothetical protein